MSNHSLGRMDRWLMQWVEGHTWWRSTPPAVLLRRRVRYALAARGVPLTRNERRLLGYRNRHRGGRCFIMGNGPSLNRCDLRPLRNEVTFGVNSIFLNEERMGFRPTYYVVEDVFVAEDRCKEILEFTGPTKFFGNYLDYCLGSCREAIWLNVCMNYDGYPGFPHFSTNAARRVSVGGTVTYMCLQLAYYMGFTEVYLIGVDHNYTIPKDAIRNATGSDITSTSDDPNHFDPRYFGKGYRWHDPRVDRMEMAYRRARERFEAAGRRVSNATVGGALEVFERVAYDALFDG